MITHATYHSENPLPAFLSPLERIEKRLAAGVPLTVAEIDEALAFLRVCESALIRHTVGEVKSAVLTEQIVIELDERMAA